MAHSIELVLDSGTEALVRRMWSALMAVDLPSQGTIRSESNRPHITLIAADRIDSGIDEVVTVVADKLPLTVEIGATLVFRGARSTVALLVVPGLELLSLHHDVVTTSRGFVPHPMFTHCEPGAWTPHVTLARRVADDQLGPCISVAEASRPGTTLTATIVGVRRWDSDARESIDLITVPT